MPLAVVHVGWTQVACSATAALDECIAFVYIMQGLQQIHDDPSLQLPQRRGAGGAVALAAAPALDIPLDDELADAPALQPDSAQVH